METKIGSAIGFLVGLVIGGIESAYMIYLRVPAVTEVRPTLIDASFQTGIFGGRGYVYLYYHYTLEMAIITTLFTGVAFAVFAFLETRSSRI